MNAQDVTFTRKGLLVAKLPHGGEVTIAPQADGRVVVKFAPGKWHLISLFTGTERRNNATFERSS